MAYNSPLPKGTVFINSKNYRDHMRGYSADPETGEKTSPTGYVPRNWEEQPLASLPGSRRMPQNLVYDMKEIKERIEERDAKGLRTIDKLRASNVRWLNQSPSWYCWCYAVVHGCMAQLILQNERHRVLVPESVAGPIKNYRKEGGWGSQALAYIVKNGVADESVWPRPNHRDANKQQYFNGSRDNAKLTKVPEFWDLETAEEKASCMLRGMVVPSGYSWMGHEMLSIDPVWVGGQLGCIDLDSYAQNGKFNTQTIMGRRSVGDDMVCIRTITPSSL